MIETITMKPAAQARMVLFFIMALVARAGYALTLPVYPAKQLREWQPEFQEAVLDNYRRLFKPNFTDLEGQILSDVRFDFPTDSESVLFGFHSLSNGTVVLPVASLLLLKDLATAQAWLEANGYSTQTVLDYLAVVSHGRLGDWPASERLPLNALGIPADALQDEQVLEKRNDILDKTLFFILGHELGHLIQGFAAQAACTQVSGACSAAAYQARQASEAQADAFAVDMMLRIGLVPSASNFFLALSSRLSRMSFEFPDQAAWNDYARGLSHPLDSERIRKVATILESDNKGLRKFARLLPSYRGVAQVDLLVDQLNVLANLIDDRDLAGMQIAWAKSMSPADLKPRKSPMPRLQPTGADIIARPPWTGYYIGKVRFDGGGEGEIEVLMRTDGAGKQITGEVMLNGIRGRLDGQLDDAEHATAMWTVAGDEYRLKLSVGEHSGQMLATYASTVGQAKGRWVLERVQRARG